MVGWAHRDLVGQKRGDGGGSGTEERSSKGSDRGERGRGGMGLLWLFEYSLRGGGSSIYNLRTF